MKVVIQSWLRPTLTPVGANCDYERFRSDLERIEANLTSRLVRGVAGRGVGFGGAAELPPDGPSATGAFRVVCSARRAAASCALGLPSFRSLSKSLASSDLLADFCGIRDIEGIKWTSKSTLDRASKVFNEKQLRRMNALLRRIGKHTTRHRDLLETSWAATRWSQRQAARIIERIDAGRVCRAKGFANRARAVAAPKHASPSSRTTASAASAIPTPATTEISSPTPLTSTPARPSPPTPREKPSKLAPPHRSSA